MHKINKIGVIILILVAGLNSNLFAANDDEIAFCDSGAKATACFAEELTIYLWSWKPVGYLDEGSAGGFHVYGFNGKHLGWFIGGIPRDHQGKAVGAIAEAFATPPGFDPFKSFKQFKPFKAFKDFPPSRPAFKDTWSDMPLKLFLLLGASD